MFIKPLNCCGLCEKYNPLPNNFRKGTCHVAQDVVKICDSDKECFVHCEKISVNMFCYFLDSLPPQLNLKEACDILGFSYGENNDE